MSMNLLFWNVRGIANEATQNVLKRLINFHNVVFLAIMEPLTQPNPERFSKALGLDFSDGNSSGKIWIFVKEGYKFEVDVDEEQILHGRLSSPSLPNQVFISAIYTKCSKTGRYPLWEKIKELSGQLDGYPWLIGGDFNTILHLRDRTGSESNRQVEMIDFADTIDDCRLLEPGSDGANFTWAKNGLLEKLDRILINESWASQFEATRVTNLPRIASDHGPILVRIKQSADRPKGRAFRFQNMWIRNEGFMEVVQNCWSRPIEAGGLLGLQVKLARVKKTLKQWNREVFGNIHNNLKKTEEKIATAQSDFETNPLSALRMVVNELIANYILLLKMEEDFWRQKASLRWLSDGDRNTRFYQSWVKQKRVRLHIHGILDNGREIEKEEEVRKSAVDFFQRLFAPGPHQLEEPNLDLIQPLPTSSSFEGLESIPTEIEVKEAVFSISGDSTPGPDGFTASFFQACWGIVGPDVVAAVGQFFNGAFLPRSITATSIVLLPKIADPKSWSDYRPISLCNVTNKIFTKILSGRLAPLLPLTVSPNQSGFIRGRLLNDNVLLAQEMFHELHRCSPAPNFAIKIDMSKAYDRVQWSFLIKVMRRMGFPETWLNLVERCIGSCWFSILINGTPSGFYKSTQGLRQGDPISPALFVIAAEYLSKARDNLILGKKEMTFKSTRGSMEISHLAYADDIIIFSQAAPGPLRRLKTCLENYAKVSGQQINISKSNFYIDEAHGRWADNIQREGGFA